MNNKKKMASPFLGLILLMVSILMLLTTGWIRGSFDRPDSTDLSLVYSSGNTGLTRYAICFQPEEGIKVRRGDSLLTGKDAKLEVQSEAYKISLRPETEIKLISADKEQPVLEVIKGSVFINCRSGKTIILQANNKDLSLHQATACVEAEDNSLYVSLYGGTCEEPGNNSEIVLRQPDQLLLHEQNDATIADLLSLCKTTDLCWQADELTQESADRERKRQAELQKKLAEEVNYSEDSSVCSISIVCDSIWNNESALNQEKKPYVPSDGIILPVTDVNFHEGETVLDVLERVCTAAEIPLEYNYTPAYKSYYIEGINHLYEFDCGPVSGWVYKVNDVSPNYGCSSFTLHKGDRIEWIYTCDGVS